MDTLKYVDLSYLAGPATAKMEIHMQHTCGWPVGTDRPVSWPQAAAVGHSEEVCNEQSMIVSLFRANANAAGDDWVKGQDGGWSWRTHESRFPPTGRLVKSSTAKMVVPF
jgi:hypothetical protein